jgi:hypothetical protein
MVLARHPLEGEGHDAVPFLLGGGLTKNVDERAIGLSIDCLY